MNKDIRELDRQIADLQARRDKLIREHRSQAIQTARRLVEEFGLTPSQVGLGSISRKPLPPSTKRPTTFYDPNHGLSWDGSLTSRGRKPAWITQAIADKTIEFFRIKVQSATTDSI
ncbi:H-NS histone family protein [Acidovorax sp. DW039]|uniref:H-NS histone family protein n=1 Tax=Acidovorax sp. DW039 TaxID=3095606 RepID=UPI00308E0D8D|nr:H-NS histone family protein [Acidovorax sp. DW039]